MEIKVAIKELAYFVCQTGNLTTEFFSNRDALDGDKAHKYLQSKYKGNSKSEVYIKKQFTYQNRNVLLHGFIDGVLDIDSEIIIEEIKSTITEIDEVDPNARMQYLAQLKLYGYLYALEHDIDKIHLRLTFISIINYETKSFDYLYSLEELENFTFDLLEKYLNWIILQENAQKLKEETIKTIKFPFVQMRPGQKEMMKACFKTMNDKDILYAIAPTGIGKTMATLFSTIKTLNQKDKLFYLTAKGSGKNAPLSAIKLLSSKGLKVKTINLTAKKKICNLKTKTCNPDECPYAIGFFDRLKNATMQIFEKEDIYDEECILKISNEHKICAFEFSLYLSYFCDIVIADYNYVFDPRAHLVRYFDDDTYSPKVLVDEAHNLISRSKDMYSSMITENDIRILRRLLTGYKPGARNNCNKVLEKITLYKDYLTDKALYVDIKNDLDLVIELKNLLNKCDEIFLENKKINNKDDVMEIYFKILDYTIISEYYGPNHRFLVKQENDNIVIQLFCLDASEFILRTIEQSIKGIVFFSATLTPFKYHADLLTQGQGKFLELQSPFDPTNLEIIINNKVSTKYKERQNSIDYILESIEILTSTHKGNYIVFFPSYQYMNMILDNIENPTYEVISQKQNLTEEDRNKIIDRFSDTSTCKVGFFVLGGIFSEGIDFIGDLLNGVIIVGVGLPLYCEENNILKDYFEEKYQNGFDYAYTFPGFTKVIQAAGRVIRSEEDKGVVILIDERFTYLKYQQLMPKHWVNKRVITNTHYLKKELFDFYKR